MKFTKKNVILLGDFNFIENKTDTENQHLFKITKDKLALKKLKEKNDLINILGLPESSVRFYDNNFRHVSTCLFCIHSSLYFYHLMYTYRRSKLAKTKLIHISFKCEALLYPWILIKFSYATVFYTNLTRKKCYRSM